MSNLTKFRKCTANKYGKIHIAPTGFNMSLCGQYISPAAKELDIPITCKKCAKEAQLKNIKV